VEFLEVSRASTSSGIPDIEVLEMSIVLSGIFGGFESLNLQRDTEH